jgi:bifunctional polynucleotide phosphatase/kinase
MWNNFDTFTFYNGLQNLPINKMKKIILFDLDNTIIKTKSKKTFPINSADWIFWSPTVKTIINDIGDKTIVGIISNQKGLGTKEKLIEWQQKITNIIKEIKIHFVFASLQDNKYRKPMQGSWNYIKENYLKNYNSTNKIIFVGDAGGREGDFNDTDLKFALNCNFKFKTPEQFFSGEKPKDLSISYPELNYYTPTEYENILEKIINKIESNNKILIIMMGYPGSGKSFIRNKILQLYPKFKYTNKDDWENKITSLNLIKKHNSSYDFIIDDNTNVKEESRKNIFDIYKSHYKIGIYFDYEIDVSMHLNYLRMFWYGKDLVKKVAYYTLRKAWKNPDKESFDLFINIDKILPDFKLETKYYF